MSGHALRAQIQVNGQPATIEGYAPFAAVAAGRNSAMAGWMLVDASRANCIAFSDGLRAIFDNAARPGLYARDLNARAGA